MVMFEDRVDAGRQLARELEFLRGQDVVVLGLPRGGVPVAFEVAHALDAPLDVVVALKLGVPSQPELAMGAIAEDGVLVIDDEVLARAGVSEDELRAVEGRARAHLDTRLTLLRSRRPQHDLRGRVAVVVDDGLATGSTARAACAVARQRGATTVILAVPVGPADTVTGFAEADQVVCPSQPSPFWAVGASYSDFSPVSDDEVVDLLDAATSE